jgi:prevent-host-death family protein
MAAHPKSFSSLPPQSTKAAAKRPRIVTRTVVPQLLGQREPIAAAKAKAHLLQLLDEVERDGRPITITKRGRVVAQLIPVPAEEKISNFDKVFGSMRGSGRIVGDIVSPDWEAWGPEWR